MHVEVCHSALQLIKSTIGWVFVFTDRIKLRAESTIEPEQLLQPNGIWMVIWLSLFFFYNNFVFLQIPHLRCVRIESKDWRFVNIFGLNSTFIQFGKWSLDWHWFLTIRFIFINRSLVLFRLLSWLEVDLSFISWTGPFFAGFNLVIGTDLFIELFIFLLFSFFFLTPIHLVFVWWWVVLLIFSFFRLLMSDILMLSILVFRFLWFAITFLVLNILSWMILFLVIWILLGWMIFLMQWFLS